MIPTWTIKQGNAIDRLREMPERSVHTVVTSPPYWALRNYGHEEMQTVWSHDGTTKLDPDHFPARRKAYPGSQSFRLRWRAAERRGVFCRYRCCWIGGLGLEPTVEMYVEHIVRVFREVRRVLRDDGTVWLNIGDSYARVGGTSAGGNRALMHLDGVQQRMTKIPQGSDLKPKDVVGMPWEVGLALRRDGWWLRRPIIWFKENPMPESATDRPTSSYEYILLLAKSEKYAYDCDAVRERVNPESVKRYGRNSSYDNGGSTKPYAMQNGPRGVTTGDTPLGANLRDVWVFPTKPFPGTHFAAFPPELPRRCILLGTSDRGVCPTCAAPWRRVIKKVATGRVRDRGKGGVGNAHSRMAHGLQPVRGTFQEQVQRHTVDWTPGCDHGHWEPVPATVLDPFTGAGTTGLVALQHERNFIGIELSPEYVQLAGKRILTDAPLLNAMGVSS